MADGSAWPAVRLWARNDRRRRWKALVVLGVLAGITAGFAMAAIAGSRRADTALDRFRSATDAADAVVFPSQVGAFNADWAALRARPEVADVAIWRLMFGNQDGDPNGLFFVADDGFGTRIGRPRVIEGRMWDPNADDEVVVTPAVAKLLAPGKPLIGSTTTFTTFAADQHDGDPDPNGPTFTFKIVGVVETINYFLFTDGQVFVGPGFYAKHSHEVLTLSNGDVKLRNGAADIPALQKDVNDTLQQGTPLLDLHAASRRVDTTISVERAALLLLGVAIAIAGGLLVAQAIARSAAVVGDDALALRAVGMTRTDVALASVAVHVITFAVAFVVAITTAVFASRLFPVGLSRKIDPDIGVHLDWTVIAPGLLLMLVLVVGGTALVARRAALADRARSRRTSRVIAAVRSVAPITIGIGTTMALDGGQGRSRVAVRPALVGAVVGVLGVIGALTIQHGVDDSLAHPDRAGVTWDATVSPPYGAYRADGIDPAFMDDVRHDVPAGTATALGSRYVSSIDGVGAPAFALSNASAGTTPISFAVINGRAPESDDEAAIGNKTAADLHVQVGAEVTVSARGLDGGPGYATKVRIVGIALFPPDVHAEFDEGIWVTDAVLEALAPDVGVEQITRGAERAVLVRYPKGTDRGAATSALSDRLGPLTGSFGSPAAADPAEIPIELQNLRNVRTLPLLLAGFLGLLAVAAVSHVLVTSSRRRRRDFAVLRAIGLNRRATRLVLNAQGTTIAVIGAAIGLPLGIAVGRTAWHWVADKVPLEDVPPFAALAVLLVIPLTVLIVNALAVWPGRAVARLRPAELLRTE